MNKIEFDALAEQNSKDVDDISKTFKLLECKYKETQKFEPALIQKHIIETRATVEKIKERTGRMMQHIGIDESYVGIVNKAIDSITEKVDKLENLIKHL